MYALRLAVTRSSIYVGVMLMTGNLFDVVHAHALICVCNKNE